MIDLTFEYKKTSKSIGGITGIYLRNQPILIINKYQ